MPNANTVRPKTIISALHAVKRPNTPDTPNNNVARCMDTSAAPRDVMASPFCGDFFVRGGEGNRFEKQFPS
ncbi:hypothetical protein, partial [uncultured Desulfovibrio sp.]|uniref:hypothetical protein n=1 Tax=uncultured Desulfovibrio sp. TaxID=167968 RepID=UPI00261555D3